MADAVWWLALHRHSMVLVYEHRHALDLALALAAHQRLLHHRIVHPFRSSRQAIVPSSRQNHLSQ